MLNHDPDNIQQIQNLIAINHVNHDRTISNTSNLIFQEAPNREEQSRMDVQLERKQRSENEEKGGETNNDIVPSAIPNLRSLAQKHRLNIIFLSETLAKARKMEQIRVALNYDACLTIDVEGKSEGLAILWKNQIKCSVFNFSINFVNLMVKDERNDQWRLTCYYGYPDRGRRRQAWDLLRDLRDMDQGLWCIIGEFNDLLSQENKWGIHPHPNWLCTSFWNAIEECDITDINLDGHHFTWHKSRGTDQMVEERLD
ncbi:hypothetical protein KIW84_032721 [Lathyrus oleraceus]|uniref:Endonuclease/exonuclease/phosphatase domain-containing protein n=1 Tax=Pisum sativum TaxID=3888 RepID=A0A9D4XVM3_PEA|nr:hypothetical protein KIW84_032721 [Pisum sativum]